MSNVQALRDELPLGPDASRSATLAARFYTSEEVFEAEKESIFYRSWHYATHISRLNEPGRYVTTSIHDQDLFLICDDSMTVRAFYNVCAHRAHPLVQGEGCKRSIVCPYHAWTYDLTGALVRARGSERMAYFDPAEIGLEEVRTERLLDFVFINLDDDARPLAELAPTLAAEMRQLVPHLDALVLKEDRQIVPAESRANWKVVVDNFLECYHCEPAHPSFCEVLDVRGMEIRCEGIVSRQFMRGTDNFDNAAYRTSARDIVRHGVFWYLWPNTSIAVLPGAPNLFISRFDPVAPERTRRTMHGLGPPGAATRQEADRDGWAGAFVGPEDLRICEAVQRGLHQRGYTQGRYVVDPDRHNLTEAPVHFFHRLYTAALEG